MNAQLGDTSGNAMPTAAPRTEHDREPSSYRHRVAQGVWINDMRNDGMSGARWPHDVLDDRSVADIVACLDLQRSAGFNAFTVFGLLTTRGWPVAYDSRSTQRTARYIRARWPGRTLLVNMCGFLRPWRTARVDEPPFLVELGRHVDALIDPGHSGHYTDPVQRPRLAAQLACALRTSGGCWVYPPQAWDRLRWFLPHPRQTAEHLRRLHGAGGRAVEYHMGPTLNPGVELNIARSPMSSARDTRSGTGDGGCGAAGAARYS